MGTPRPTQYQRRKWLVTLVLSTPLLRQFPEDAEDLEEQQPRTPFHLRTPPKFNVVDSFNTMHIKEEKKEDLHEAMPDILPASSANRPVRSTRAGQSYYGQALTGRDAEKYIRDAEMVSEETSEDSFVTP